jgi:Tol biopolymer transport system component
MRKLFISGILVGLIALLTALPAAARTAGANGQIVYGNNNNVFTANPDGSNSRLLEANTCCASWSPDGSKIALAANTADGRITAATVSPDGTGYTPFSISDPTLNLGPGAPGAWSPDGSRLALEGWADTSPGRDGVYTASATDGSDLVRLTSNPYGGHDIPGDYSPDGTRIAFFRENPNLGHDRFALSVVSVNGGAVHRLSGWQSDFGGASWSPDGQWILTDNSRGGLYVVHPDGSGRHQIPLAVGSRAFAFTPSWSPDGKQIIFALFTAKGPGSGQEAIYTANADGSGLQSTGLQGDAPAWGTHPLTP